MGSVEYLDFDHKVLVTEAAFIGILTNGGVGYRDMLGMDFTVYEHLVKKVPDLIREKTNGT